MTSGEGYSTNREEILGTRGDLERIAALEVPPELQGLDGLRDFLREHRVVESFAAAIIANATDKEPESGYYTTGDRSDLHAELNAGTGARSPFSYTGPGLHISKDYRGADRMRTGGYGLVIPTTAPTAPDTIAVNDDKTVHPSAWIAERWTTTEEDGSESYFDYNFALEESEGNNARGFIDLVKLAAKDLAVATTPAG